MQTLKPKCLLCIFCFCPRIFLYSFTWIVYIWSACRLQRRLTINILLNDLFWKHIWAMFRFVSIFTSINLLFTDAVIFCHNKKKIYSLRSDAVSHVPKRLMNIFCGIFIIQVWKQHCQKPNFFFLYSMQACDIYAYVLVCLFVGLCWLLAKRSELKRTAAARRLSLSLSLHFIQFLNICQILWKLISTISSFFYGIVYPLDDFMQREVHVQCA